MINFGKAKKRNKYGAIKTTFHGVTYDSKAEAARAKQLSLMKAAGRIRWWHPKPGTFRLGCPENRYRPDFMVCSMEDQVWCEDVKGIETPKFQRDVKLWEVYGDMPLRIISAKNPRIITPKGS